MDKLCAYSATNKVCLGPLVEECRMHSWVALRYLCGLHFTLFMLFLDLEALPLFPKCCLSLRILGKFPLLQEASLNTLLSM